MILAIDEEDETAYDFSTEFDLDSLPWESPESSAGAESDGGSGSFEEETLPEEPQEESAESDGELLSYLSAPGRPNVLSSEDEEYDRFLACSCPFCFV